MTLSVRPFSKLGESLISYVLRLTVRNWFDKPTGYFHPSFIKAASQNKLSNKVIREQSCNFENFNEFGETSHDAIFHPLFKRNHIQEPRLCPSCVLEKGILDKTWQIATNLHCNEHNCLLVDTCPHCKEVLTWGTNLIEGKCTNKLCNRILKSIHPSPDILALTPLQVLDCYTAGYFVENTGCTILKQLTTSQFHSYMKSFFRGYYLLTNVYETEKWHLALTSLNEKNMPLPDDFRNISASILIKLLKCDWPLKSSISSFSENRGNTKDLITKITPYEPSSIELPLKEASILLNLEKSDFKSLFDAGLLTISNASLNQHSRLNFEPLFRFLLSGSQLTKDSMTYFKLKNHALLYLVDFIDLLIGCKQGKIEFTYCPSAYLQSSIFFNPDSVRKFIVERMQSINNELTSVVSVMELTNTTSEELSYAIKNNIISKPKLYRHSNHLKNKDLIRLVKLKNVMQLELDIF